MLTCSRSVANRNRPCFLPLLDAFVATGRVAVLLLFLIYAYDAAAHDTASVEPRVFQFSCEFQFPVGRGHLDGLMASDGSRQRIAIYWIEPDVFRESDAFIRYADFIFTSQAIYYWIYPGPEPGMFLPREDLNDAFLPREDSPESLVRSVLAAVNSMEVEGEKGDALKVGEFLRSSRGLAEYGCETMPGATKGDSETLVADRDLHVLNNLPSGRRYSKESQADGTRVWRIWRLLYRQPVAIAAVKRVTRAQEESVFDVNSLGCWTLIPESYRVYWNLDRVCGRLKGRSDCSSASLDLYREIESYLENDDIPLQVQRALHRVWTKTALMTDDMDRIRRSVQTAVIGLCHDMSLTKYRRILELARISGQIETWRPQESQQWLRPLVGHMVEHAGSDIGECVNRLMPMIDANRWFTYGTLLLDETRKQGLMAEEALEEATIRLEATRLAREDRPADPCNSSSSVRAYMAHLDADPRSGMIDMNDVHQILQDGLVKYCAYTDPARKSLIIDDVVHSLRLIVGDGPFSGDSDMLTRSISRFSECYAVVNQEAESICTVLSTFLALSFCDISTRQDHETLFSQFRAQSADLQSQVNMALRTRGLSSLVTPECVRSAFLEYEHVFREHIEDPLCPMLKFPLTTIEEARLAGTLRLWLMRLAPLWDEVSSKVKYGGGSAELKELMLYEIARVAEQLVPETAFLRRPMYPGVSCHYRGKSGLVAAIEEPLYTNDGRPKEKFKAMKYFHLGHRLQEVVERECEMAKHELLQEQTR